MIVPHPIPKIFYTQEELLHALEAQFSSYPNFVSIVDRSLGLETRFPSLHSFLKETKIIVSASEEDLKTPKGYLELAEQLQAKNIHRKSAIIALGGGVLMDVAGFLASTYMRGIDYYNIPTTLLGMVDAAIGGKTGINFCKNKNILGSFYNPKGVFLCLSFLTTLPKQSFISGMAEVIKYSLIQDGSFFEFLEELPIDLYLEPSNLYKIVNHCVGLKLNIVNEDPLEKLGTRFSLNLGHTFAHALESVSQYRYTHGQAVAIGLFLAATYSYKLGFITHSTLNRLASLLHKYGLATHLHASLDAQQLVHAMLKDKKNTNQGVINLILLERIGKTIIHPCSDLEGIKALWQQVGAV